MVIRIDALPQTVLPSRQHEFPAMNDGQTVKLSVDQVLELADPPAEPGSVIHAATAKATLADNDEFGVSDSAASFVLKRTKLTELISSIFKTTRKIANAYFLSSFRLWDATDNTKGLGVVLSGITTATTRLITMVDRDINLANVPTPLVAYTPTFTGFGTVSGVTARSCRVGANLQIEIDFTSGTPTAVPASVTLGFNGVNGGLAVDSAYANRRIVGTWGSSEQGTTVAIPSILAAAGSSVFNFGAKISGRSVLTVINGDVVANPGDSIRLTCSIPIQGWNV